MMITISDEYTLDEVRDTLATATGSADVTLRQTAALVAMLRDVMRQIETRDDSARGGTVGPSVIVRDAD